MTLSLDKTINDYDLINQLFEQQHYYTKRDLENAITITIVGSLCCLFLGSYTNTLLFNDDLKFIITSIYFLALIAVLAPNIYLPISRQYQYTKRLLKHINNTPYHAIQKLGISTYNPQQFIESVDKQRTMFYRHLLTSFQYDDNRIEQFSSYINNDCYCQQTKRDLESIVNQCVRRNFKKWSPTQQQS